MSEKSEEKEKRERQFIVNGSKLLEKLIVSCNGKPIPIRSFFAKELRQATNNYNNHYGMLWFKGSLDGQIVIVRRLPSSKFWADLAINDLAISAQMSAHISIPDGETDVEVDGNCLYSKFKTPEFKATGRATEKTDVYYFGKLLFELLTGEDSYNITRLTIDKKSSLIAYMHNHAQVCCINEIVDPTILAAEGGASLEPQLQAFLQLALTCAGEDPQRRPTMVDVTKELRRIESFVL
ncbi:probable inactive receptor kinase RLK902 [Quercus lobata]|uniref:probable inactive receptor kinase RLK902 n=1 Tax=Quercus lobata TaxID=97700 RepID=UPI0012475284|nr:probable inactive receptor kinase RLK902 [Quercus lobata]